MAATGYHLFTAATHSPKNLKQPNGFKMRVSTDLSAFAQTNKTDALRKQAQALEAAFLAEMLSHTGLDAASEGFGGGIGEDQFGSFLREEQAKLMVSRGGIGLSESLFKALSERSND
jgi:peptidoglycan hydrolase FlgJ